jgi:hypothetical protein
MLTRIARLVGVALPIVVAAAIALVVEAGQRWR